MAIIGCRCMNDASLSSASATRYWPVPRRALLSALFKRPPMTKVGSSPPSARMRRDHAGRRGLAVRAGDRDRVTEAHQFAEHHRALHDGQATRLRLDDFGIVRLHGGRDDQHVGLADVLGRVTDLDLRTQPRQPLRDSVRLQVAALNFDSRGSTALRRCRPCRCRRCRRNECDGCDACDLSCDTSARRRRMRRRDAHRHR